MLFFINPKHDSRGSPFCKTSTNHHNNTIWYQGSLSVRIFLMRLLQCGCFIRTIRTCNQRWKIVTHIVTNSPNNFFCVETPHKNQKKMGIWKRKPHVFFLFVSHISRKLLSFLFSEKGGEGVGVPRQIEPYLHSSRGIMDVLPDYNILMLQQCIEQLLNALPTQWFVSPLSREL